MLSSQCVFLGMLLCSSCRPGFRESPQHALPRELANSAAEREWEVQVLWADVQVAQVGLVFQDSASDILLALLQTKWPSVDRILVSA